MAIITWESGLVPEGMEIKQVYGIIFTEDGRIMLRTEQKPDCVKFSLPGGHPESIDELAGTLKEAFGERLVYIALQGSYLRNEPTKNSDIDIMAETDNKGV